LGGGRGGRDEEGGILGERREEDRGERRMEEYSIIYNI